MIAKLIDEQLNPSARDDRRTLDDPPKAPELIADDMYCAEDDFEWARRLA